MSTVNQTFDWRRFTALLGKELTENGRSLGLAFAAIYLFYAFTLTFTNWASRGVGGLDLDPMFVFLFIAIIASLGFSGLISKNKRTEYLALPASTVEKFSVNTLIYVIGAILGVFACIYLADLTRIAILWFKRSEDFFVPGPIAFSSVVIKWVNPLSEYWSCLPKFLLNCLWYASVFMLGSILWPKRSILKTSVAVIACFIIIGIIGIEIAKTGPNASDRFDAIIKYLDVVVIILCWVGGWLLFKGKDVISKKWWS